MLDAQAVDRLGKAKPKAVVQATRQISGVGAKSTREACEIELGISPPFLLPNLAYPGGSDGVPVPRHRFHDRRHALIDLPPAVVRTAGATANEAIENHVQRL